MAEPLTTVTPLDKGKPNKYEISNCRPVSILKTFSKIYGKITKNQLIYYFDKVFFPCLAAYREGCSTEQEIVRLIEEWRGGLDNDCVVGAVLMNMSKPFDCIPYGLIVTKIAAYDLNFNDLRLMFSYLQGRHKCVKINNIQSNFLY